MWPQTRAVKARHCCQTISSMSQYMPSLSRVVAGIDQVELGTWDDVGPLGSSGGAKPLWM